MFTALKLISTKNNIYPVNFWKPDGSIQEIYGFCIVHFLTDGEKRLLMVNDLLSELEPFEWESTFNPHFTLVNLILQEGKDQGPFSEHRVDQVVTKVQELWKERQITGPFELELKDVVIRSMPERGASRLTIEGYSPRLEELKRYYFQDFPMTVLKGYQPNPIANINIGVSKKLNYSEPAQLEQQRILDRYNRFIQNRVLLERELLVSNATLIYQTNNFLSNNLSVYNLLI